jgi:hypothetical protein
MNMQVHEAAIQASPHPVFPVTVDALTREIYETASSAMRARMKAQACARVMPGLAPAERSRLLDLVMHLDATVLAEIRRDEPDWACSGVGAALLWMVETDLRAF